MVRVLISMRSAALRNRRSTRFGAVSVGLTAVVGLLAATGTLLLGATAPPTGGADQIALLLLVWAAGRIGLAAFAGSDPAFPLDLFRALPLERRRLADGLLAVTAVEPSLVLLGVASGALVVFGFRRGVGAGLVGVLAAVLYVAAVAVAALIASALVPTGSRARRDAGTLLAALVISGVLVSGSAAPAALAALAGGRLPALALTIDVLPAGWAADAVVLASRGAVLPVAGLLLLLLLLVAGMVAVWPGVLQKRLETVPTPRRHRHAVHPRLRLPRPASPTAAVAVRELRLWIRDPVRLGMLTVAVVVGLGVCAVPLLTRGAAFMLPFAGAGTAVVAGAVAGNSYGFDGAAFGLTLSVPGSESSDVRGRQLAWFLLVGPYAVALGTAGVLVSGAAWSWPWMLTTTVGVLGGAAGASALVSAIAPQPLEDGGGLTPAWTVKAYLTLALTTVSVLPGTALLVVGATTESAPAAWAAPAVSVVFGCAAAWLLGRAAARRLEARGPEVLAALTGSTARR